MAKHGFEENVSFVDNVSKDGVITNLSFEGEELIVKRTYDATPHLEYARQAREATDGQNWGTGRMIGHIPPVEYAKFLMIKDNVERKKAIMVWLRQNTAFTMFHKALK